MSLASFNMPQKLSDLLFVHASQQGRHDCACATIASSKKVLLPFLFNIISIAPIIPDTRLKVTVQLNGS